MKGGGYECCSICTIIGQSVSIEEEGGKVKHYTCYLPTEHTSDRTHATFTKDAAQAKYIGVPVSIIKVNLKILG